MLNLKLKSEIKNNLLTYIIKWEFDEATDRETLYLDRKSTRLNSSH